MLHLVLGQHRGGGGLYFYTIKLYWTNTIRINKIGNFSFKDEMDRMSPLPNGIISLGQVHVESPTVDIYIGKTITSVSVPIYMLPTCTRLPSGWLPNQSLV